VPPAAHHRRHSRSHHHRHGEHSPTPRQPHSNGLCSLPKEGPGPGCESASLHPVWYLWLKLGLTHGWRTSFELGRSGPNLEPGTMRVYVTNGPRNGLNIGRKVGPCPGSRRRWVLGSVRVFSQAFHAANTYRPRCQVKTRASNRRA